MPAGAEDTTLRLTFSTGRQAGETLELSQPRIVIGRSRGCDVVVKDRNVSRRHAAITRTLAGGLLIHDLDSVNGTSVDGKKVHGRRELREGSRILVGDTVLEVDGDRPPLRASSERQGKALADRRVTGLKVVAVAIAAIAVAAAVALVVTSDGGGDGKALPGEVPRAVMPAVAHVTTSIAGQRTRNGSG